MSRITTCFPLIGLAFVVSPAMGGGSGDVDVLADWMTGTFSSAEQARADTSFSDVRLLMIPIWHHRSDGPWLYVEQALGDRVEAPYRQRMYRLSAGPGGAIHSEVFTFPDPLRFAGEWRNRMPFAGLNPDSLTRRDGCTVTLRRQTDGAYAGGTSGDGCASTLRGARYATSEVELRPNEVRSWDRGFDAEGRQVWGSTGGAYVFQRTDGHR